MRISDWSSDVCSSDLTLAITRHQRIAIQRIAGNPTGESGDALRMRSRLLRERADIDITIGRDQIRRGRQRDDTADTGQAGVTIVQLLNALHAGRTEQIADLYRDDHHIPVAQIRTEEGRGGKG